MESIKNLVAILAGIVGVLTSILTLYAKYLDVKKENAGEAKAAEASMVADVAPKAPAGFARMDDPIDLVGSFIPDPHRVSPFELAQKTVKAPAIALIIAGMVSFFANLGMGGLGLIDRFVVPIGLDSRDHQAPLQITGGPNYPAGMPTSPSKQSDDEAMVLGIFGIMSLCVPSAVAVWAGFGMLRLKSYWVSVAGSVAIMLGGALFCCIGGFPVGIWSLVILFRPDVVAAYR